MKSECSPNFCRMEEIEGHTACVIPCWEQEQYYSQPEQQRIPSLTEIRLLNRAKSDALKEQYFKTY